MDEIQPPDLDLHVCPACGLLHPRKPTLTCGDVAFLSSYKRSSIFTFHSRGGFLPRTAMNGRGNPRWSSCQIARWLAGSLPESDIEPVRRRKSGA